MALKQTLDKRAVYDEDSAANLLNAAKYSAVADLLWPFIVPAQGHPSSIAGTALLCAKKLWHRWSFDGWVGIPISDTVSGWYNCWHHNFSPELWWLMKHASAIDCYAADGTHPASHLFDHVTLLGSEGPWQICNRHQCQQKPEPAVGRSDLLCLLDHHKAARARRCVDFAQ